MPRSPKDTFITVYGRKPVLEALDNAELRVDKVVFAEGSRGHLGRQVIARHRLDGGRDPQSYALGVKELWEVPADKATAPRKTSIMNTASGKMAPRRV